MNHKIALAQKAELLNFLPIESNDLNILYVVDPNDRRKILISNTTGKMILTRNQARTMIDELKGILEAF